MPKPKNKPTENEPTKNEPTKNEPTENEPTKNEPTKNEPPTEVPDLSEAIAGITAEIASIKQAISALANQGAVNGSVAVDNGEEYPEIDIDEVNRLMGA